ncbi:hypothetical protein [Paenibacillus sp. OV219]|uniref:hypothetical protein n=1 Tax=Paenibacillus sp. OV219 TaxID=1884377 RepID=UPI0008C97363|nr:hypothetical protein [Paenibacillus sp. OV219]SEN99356.1 hypothetical protein SAMN05518847_105191 [Paenibacillus sp. OV219]
MLWIAFLVAAGAVSYEYPKLRRAKQFKELWVFAVTLAFGLVLSIAENQHFPIPNPLDLITTLYKPMSRAILSIFN